MAYLRMGGMSIFDMDICVSATELGEPVILWDFRTWDETLGPAAILNEGTAGSVFDLRVLRTWTQGMGGGDGVDPNSFPGQPLNVTFEGNVYWGGLTLTSGFTFADLGGSLADLPMTTLWVYGPRQIFTDVDGSGDFMTPGTRNASGVGDEFDDDGFYGLFITQGVSHSVTIEKFTDTADSDDPTEWGLVAETFMGGPKATPPPTTWQIRRDISPSDLSEVDRLLTDIDGFSMVQYSDGVCGGGDVWADEVIQPTTGNPPVAGDGGAALIVDPPGKFDFPSFNGGIVSTNSHTTGSFSKSTRIFDPAAITRVHVTGAHGVPGPGGAGVTPTYVGGFSPLADDYAVMFITGIGNGSTLYPGLPPTPSGSEHLGSSVFLDAGGDIYSQMHVFGKRLTVGQALPAITIDYNPTPNANTQVKVMVLRGVDPTTALDAASVSSDSGGFQSVSTSSTPAGCTAVTSRARTIQAISINYLDSSCLFATTIGTNDTNTQVYGPPESIWVKCVQLGSGAVAMCESATLAVTPPTWFQLGTAADRVWTAVTIPLRPASSALNCDPETDWEVRGFAMFRGIPSSADMAFWQNHFMT